MIVYLYIPRTHPRYFTIIPNGKLVVLNGSSERHSSHKMRVHCTPPAEFLKDKLWQLKNKRPT